MEQVERVIAEGREILAETGNLPIFGVSNGAFSVRTNGAKMNPKTLSDIIRRGELDEWTRETFALTDEIADHFEAMGVDIAEELGV